MRELTEKQRQFAANKAAGVSHRDAAIAAGYSHAAAETTATKLMRDPRILAAIKVVPKEAPGVDMPRAEYTDPMAFLEDVMNHPQLPVAMRMEAAKQLLPYRHARMGAVGKKERAQESARKLADQRPGAYVPKLPPHSLKMLHF